MIEVGWEQLQLWVSAFFWPFCRLLAFLASDPILGHKNISSQVKIGLALGILNRVAPQPTVFSVGFPATLFVGMLLLTVLVGHMGQG